MQLAGIDHIIDCKSSSQQEAAALHVHLPKSSANGVLLCAELPSMGQQHQQQTTTFYPTNYKGIMHIPHNGQ